MRIVEKEEKSLVLTPNEREFLRRYRLLDETMKRSIEAMMEVYYSAVPRVKLKKGNVLDVDFDLGEKKLQTHRARNKRKRGTFGGKGK